MRVYVYFNLHKKRFSVQAREGDRYGRVVASLDRVTLTNCEFSVNQAGRLRVLKEKRKNVHAGINGDWDESTSAVSDGRSVTYDPYKYESFVFREGLNPIQNATKASLFVIGGSGKITVPFETRKQT